MIFFSLRSDLCLVAMVRLVSSGQWSLDPLRYKHISITKYVFISQHVQWHWPLDTNFTLFVTQQKKENWFGIRFSYLSDNKLFRIKIHLWLVQLIWYKCILCIYITTRPIALTTRHKLHPFRYFAKERELIWYTFLISFRQEAV